MYRYLRVSIVRRVFRALRGNAMKWGYREIERIIIKHILRKFQMCNSFGTPMRNTACICFRPATPNFFAKNLDNFFYEKLFFSYYPHN